MSQYITYMRVKSYNYITLVFMTLFALVCTGSNSAWAQSVQFPSKPPQNVFITDQAKLLSAADFQTVSQIAQKILIDERTPIYVVTINSLSDHGAESMSVELYTQMLFDNWGIGYKNRNYGMLLLISKSDRKMRMELGKDWAGTRNQDADYLVNRVMAPRFKEGNYSEGIVAGVQGMDGMARGLSLPSPYYSWWVLPAVFILTSVLIAVTISVFKSGKKGAGWAFLLLTLAAGFFLLKIIVSFQSTGNGHGFGGGSSGGGGASGSW